MKYEDYIKAGAAKILADQWLTDRISRIAKVKYQGGGWDRTSLGSSWCENPIDDGEVHYALEVFGGEGYWEWKRDSVSIDMAFSSDKEFCAYLESMAEIRDKNREIKLQALKEQRESIERKQLAELKEKYENE